MNLIGMYLEDSKVARDNLLETGIRENDMDDWMHVC